MTIGVQKRKIQLNRNKIYQQLKLKCTTDPAGSEVLALVDKAITTHLSE